MVIATKWEDRISRKAHNSFRRAGPNRTTNWNLHVFNVIDIYTNISNDIYRKYRKHQSKMWVNSQDRLSETILSSPLTWWIAPESHCGQYLGYCQAYQDSCIAKWGKREPTNFSKFSHIRKKTTLHCQLVFFSIFIFMELSSYLNI